MTLKTLSTKNVVISFAGIQPQGLADGTYCTIELPNLYDDPTIGADGEVVRMRSKDNTATVTLSLLQTSDANAALNQIYLADKAGINGEGVGSFQLEDLQSGTRYNSAKAYIMTHPGAEFGDAPTNRSWVLKLVDIEVSIGVTPQS